MKTTFRYSSVGLHSRHDGERCNHVIFRYIRNGARLKRALVLLLVIFAACSPDESQFRYTVNGRVTEQGGANINGNNLSITLSPATSNDKIVNSDGSYTFHKVIEGEYTVSVTDNSGMFYEETSDPFHVGKGSNNNVQITLRRRAFSITGKVTDASTNSAISGVSVKYSGAIVATTDASGNYTTPQYQPGSYSFTFEKDGYQAKTASTTISNTGASPLDVKLTPTVSNGSIYISSDSKILTISNGFSCFISSRNVVSYYYGTFLTSTLSSDNNIINTLLADYEKNDIESSDRNKDDFTYWYSWGRSANTSYTICILGVDEQGRYTALYKKQVTTKSAANQPEVQLSNFSAGSSSYSYTATMNSRCSKFKGLVIYSNSNALQDSYLALRVHFYIDDFRTSSPVSLTASRNYSYTYSYIVHFGYDSSGNNSGVVNVTLINNSMGQIVTRPTSVAVRKGDGSLLMKEVGVEKADFEEIKLAPIK